jgi:hypothetical protein
MPAATQAESPKLGCVSTATPAHRHGSVVEVDVFVVVPVVRRMPMTVVDVIQMVVVPDRSVATSVAMDVVVIDEVVRAVPWVRH